MTEILWLVDCGLGKRISTEPSFGVTQSPIQRLRGTLLRGVNLQGFYVDDFPPSIE